MANEGATGELVRYRRAGGMAGLDQRLSVGADGRAVLEDRKSRSSTEIVADASEIEGLRVLIDEVPRGRWHGVLGTFVQRVIPRGHSPMRFQLRRGRRRIDGVAGVSDADLGPLLAQLDELLARCVRERRG